MRKKIAILLTIAILSILQSSCIRDGMEECRVYLEFIYDLNMEYSDSFVDHVDHVDIFVFDENDLFLFTRKFHRDQLTGGKRIQFGQDLSYGIYKIFTIGGLSEDFEITDKNGDPCTPGSTTLDEVVVYLNRHSRIVSSELSPLWIGETITVDYQAAITTYPVHLTKDTNHFILQLSQSENSGETDKNDPAVKSAAIPYTFEIVSPEGAVYSWENKPLLIEPMIYAPYELAPGAEPEIISVGQINTCRLFNVDQYRLLVRNIDTREIEWSYDLMRLLSYAKPENRPDGTTLPMQEYLDRESEWDINLLHREDNDSFVAVAIIINGWIMWMHEIN